ncbi:MAG: acyl-ACP--UDP-N-acetylglucosamine O-acyltransferase [Candidatus Obscuribacterales bacterium]|nr:acyl-ACP--UDP-N-acetylglucosamine O-acyltransferase [Steroidobacteraceae bacterium]
MGGSIHPTAVVHPDAVIASDAEIGPYCVIGAQVEIGPGCKIGPHAVVNGPTRMGRDNRVFQFSSIGEGPQDLTYNGEPTRLEVGDRNTFRENTTVHRGTMKDKGVTRIGSDNLFLVAAHIAHDCVVGNHCVLSNSVGLAGHVELGDWVILSAYAGVHQFCKVGSHAFLANNTAATYDIPPYVTAEGRPAEPRIVNEVGLKRRGFTPEQIRNIRNAFRLLYRSDLKLTEATERLQELGQTQPEVQVMVDFLARSERGIAR